MADIEPFQYKFRGDLIDTLINQIYKGETIALLGLPGVGKTNTIYWFKSQADKLKNLLIVHIDLNNLVSTNDIAFYRLFLLELNRSILKNLKNQSLVDFSNTIFKECINLRDNLLTFDAIKRIIQEILVYDSQVICILIDGFEKLAELHTSILNSLTAIRAMDKNHISYLFVGNTDLEEIFTPQKAGDLYSLLTYNKLWLRTLNKNETFDLIEEFSELLDLKTSKLMREKIWELSGGHAWYIKILTKILNESHYANKTNINDIYKVSGIQTRAEYIWETLSKDSRELLFNILNKKKFNLSDIPEFLIKSGLIKINKKKVTFFSPLFEYYVQKIFNKTNDNSRQSDISSLNKNPKGLYIDVKKQLIYKDNIPLKISFTKNEFKLLKYFFDNESSVISREKVAEIIWGTNMNKKYSDWAIDKIISRIREKIEDDSRKPKYLKTVRGVGFKFQLK